MQERFPLKIYKKENVESKITYVQFVGLPETDHTGELTGTKGRETCSDINFDECLYQQREDEMRRQTKDNCTAPYTPNNNHICNDLDDIRKAYPIAMNKFEGHKTGSAGAINCAMNCKTLFVEVGAKSESVSRKKLERKDVKNFTTGAKEMENLEFYRTPNFKATFGPVIQKIEEHQLYTFMNLIAESGKVIIIPSVF